MDRFKLEKSTCQDNWWVLTDTLNLVVVRFKEHEYNETQKVSILEESALKSSKEIASHIAKIMREMAVWLMDNHKNLI